LQLNDTLLVESKEYKKLKQAKRIEDEQYLSLSDTKEPYPLPKIKYLIARAIDYIEKYDDEILDIAKHYIKTKGLHQGKMYTGDFDYFKNRKEMFKESRLQRVQNKVKNTQQRYLNERRINLGRSIAGYTIRLGMYNAIKEMETSCIMLVLMITGMRVGELCTLERNLSIREDEHFNLTRVVYKTASTPEGDKLEMPIPDIARKALVLLSKLAIIKDGKKEGNIILSPISREKMEPVRTSRINSLINEYCEPLDVDTPPTPHQFRHAMAFLIVHINERDGLELARMFLGHKSITMTLQYMGHYNNELKDAITELRKEESEQLVGAITDEIANNQKIFGVQGERLMPRHKFMGKQADEFIMLLKKALLQLIDEKRLAILQTPVCLCIHDTEKVDSMLCQRGFDIKEIVERGPAPSRCSGANCSNAIFFEKHIERLKVYDGIEPELKARLEKNTYFMEAGGFDNDPFKRIIKEYNEYKKGS
jgi:integrase